MKNGPNQTFLFEPLGFDNATPPCKIGLNATKSQLILVSNCLLLFAGSRRMDQGTGPGHGSNGRGLRQEGPGREGQECGAVQRVSERGGQR